MSETASGALRTPSTWLTTTSVGANEEQKLGNWYEHEPPEGWDAPRAVPGGIEVGSHFFPLSYFDAVPAAKLRKAEEELKEFRAKAGKAKKAEREAERLERLEQLKHSTADLKAPRWMAWDGAWRWCVYDEGQGRFVDSGIRPEPGIPLTHQNPSA
jgi:hypothetical protein